MAACKAEFFKCPLCTRRGCDASHKMGGRDCNPPPPPRKRNIAQEKRTATPAAGSPPAIGTAGSSMAATAAIVGGEREATPAPTPMETAQEEAGK